VVVVVSLAPAARTGTETLDSLHSARRTVVLTVSILFSWKRAKGGRWIYRYFGSFGPIRLCTNRRILQVNGEENTYSSSSSR
jgi:hypothetical protein